jgi:DEAD/DEAH box helicase domain-containing protein
MHTTALWWEADPRALEALLPRREQAMEGFLGAAYALHHVAALQSMAEIRDLGRAVGDVEGTWSAVLGSDGRGFVRGPDNAPADPYVAACFAPTLFLYDNYPGGVGLSAPLFDAANTLVADAQSLIRDCPCSAGCPACVGPILTGDDARDVTPKALALRVLGLLGGA